MCIAIVEAVSPLWKLHRHCGSCIAHQGEGRAQGGLSNMHRCHGSCITIMEAVLSLSLWKLHHPLRRGQGQVIKHVSPLWKLHCHHGSCIAIVVCYASAVYSLPLSSSSCHPHSSWLLFFCLCVVPPHRSSWSHTSCPSSSGASFSSS